MQAAATLLTCMRVNRKFPIEDHASEGMLCKTYVQTCMRLSSPRSDFSTSP